MNDSTTELAAAATFPVQTIALMLFVALVLSISLTRLLRYDPQAEGRHRLQRWLPAMYVAIWGGFVTGVGWTLASQGWSAKLALVLVLLLVFVMASLGWLRSVAAGIVIVWERRIHPGNHIRLHDVSGEVIGLGTRALQLRSEDGVVHQIPNELILSQPFSRTSPAEQAICEILVDVPPGMAPQEAMRLGLEAALLTPLASLRERPEVFLTASVRPTFVIRGYAFSPAYRDHYRSDILARLHAVFGVE